jgi:hypothetical protein
MSDQPSSSTSALLSSTTEVPQDVPAQTSTQVVYGKPEIDIEPKPDWKCRYPKDLIPTSKKEPDKKPKKKPKYQRKTTKLNKEKKMKFIGLLQGVGNQRSRIRVKVRC